MGFEILNRRSARASGVAVNVTKNKTAQAGHGLSGFFRLAPDVVKDAGWKPGEPIQILIGTEEDRGKFILKPSKEGRTVPFKPKAGASLQVSFSAMSAGFQEATGGTKEVEYEIGDHGEITVTVPGLRGEDGNTHSTSRKSRKS